MSEQKTPTDTHEWICPCCGEKQQGLINSISYDHPAGWDSEKHPDVGRSKLHSDLCVIELEGGRLEYYIRCVMVFPIQTLSDTMMFGVWASVSESSFNVYVDGYSDGQYELDGCFGYLANDIRNFSDSFNLHVDVEFGNADQRPMIWLHDAEHPLVEAQEHGLPVQYVEDLTRSFQTH